MNKWEWKKKVLENSESYVNMLGQKQLNDEIMGNLIWYTEELLMHNNYITKYKLGLDRENDKTFCIAMMSWCLKRFKSLMEHCVPSNYSGNVEVVGGVNSLFRALYFNEKVILAACYETWDRHMARVIILDRDPKENLSLKMIFDRRETFHAIYFFISYLRSEFTIPELLCSLGRAEMLQGLVRKLAPLKRDFKPRLVGLR